MTAQVYDFGTTLGAGFDGLFDEGRGYKLSVVPLKDILVTEQVRQEMESEESTLDEMGGSIKQHGILQTLLLRPIAGAIPYKLVAGGRRYLGAQRAGEVEVPAMIKEMTDEQEADIQLAENIHRKNLTQIEVAKKIQLDLDKAGGDVEAVMVQHNKGRAWLSKMLSLLTLTPEAKRLLTENISADLEVIGKVKVIEKIDPAAAKALVDDLAATHGKEDARKKANAVKDQVKPPKPKAEQPAPPAEKTPVAGNFADAKTVLTPAAAWPFPTCSKGSRPAAPAPAAGPAAKQGEDNTEVVAADPRETLDRAYGLIFEDGTDPKVFVETLDAADRGAIVDWLDQHYFDGRKEMDLPRAIMLGLRTGKFATDGAGAFAMMAFVQGAESTVKPLDLVYILGLAKT